MTSGWQLKGQERDEYVEGMFDRIARPYDRLNRLISLGRDQQWRREVVRLSGVFASDVVVDLGTGTGDLGIEFAKQVGPSGRVIGVDLARGMLDVAREKAAATPWYSVHRAPVDQTGLKDSMANAISMGWVLRNVGDRSAVYREVQRIAKPGARFVCIDMSHPKGMVKRAGYWVYRHGVMPVLARVSGGDREAYKYLAGSTDHFPDAEALAQEWRDAGFQDVQVKCLMMGALATHSAICP